MSVKVWQVPSTHNRYVCVCVRVGLSSLHIGFFKEPNALLSAWKALLIAYRALLSAYGALLSVRACSWMADPLDPNGENEYKALLGEFWTL